MVADTENPTTHLCDFYDELLYDINGCEFIGIPESYRTMNIYQIDVDSNSSKKVVTVENYRNIDTCIITPCGDSPILFSSDGSVTVQSIIRESKLRRPEHLLSGIVDFDKIDSSSAYRSLLGIALFQRGLCSLGTRPFVWESFCLKHAQGMEKVDIWLNQTDFYTAPASTRFHDSFRGGLVRHTLNVVNNLHGLLSCPQFDNVNLGSANFVSLVHDWCKVGLYESYNRNVKDKVTGEWKQVEAYTYRDDRAISLGHGVSSMYLASKFARLSLEECAAIRWHMGRWNCNNSEYNELQQSNKQFPLVHLVQFADQLAITDYGVN